MLDHSGGRDVTEVDWRYMFCTLVRALHSGGKAVMGLASRVKVVIVVRRDHEAGRAVSELFPKSMDVRWVKLLVVASMLESWFSLSEKAVHFVRVLQTPGSAPVNRLVYRSSVVSWVIADHCTGRLWLSVLVCASTVVSPVMVVHSFGRDPSKLFECIILR